jgi:hypothetical protein
MAPLLAEYSARCGRPAVAATEQVLTIAAWPRSWAAQVRQRRPGGPGNARHIHVQNVMPFLV